MTAPPPAVEEAPSRAEFDGAGRSHRPRTTISHAFAIASYTTWSHFDLGPLMGCCWGCIGSGLFRLCPPRVRIRTGENMSVITLKSSGFEAHPPEYVYLFYLDRIERQSKQPSPKTKARKKEVVPLRTFLFSGKKTRKPSFFEARPQPPKSKNVRRLEKRSFFSRKTKPNRAQKETQHKTQRYEPKFCCQQRPIG